METLKTLRERNGLTQKRLAELVGVTGGALSQIEAGDLALSEKLATRMASHLGERVSAKRLLTISSTLVAMKAATASIGQGHVALKSADDPETYLKVGAKAHRLEAHPQLPDEVRQAVQDIIVQANEAVLKQASQELASGVTGSFTVPEGSTLDPNLDPQNLRVASGGDGWFYVIDMESGQLVLTFGNVAQQMGQPLGSKRATKSREDREDDEPKYGSTRDSLGRNRPTKQERRKR